MHSTLALLGFCVCSSKCWQTRVAVKERKLSIQIRHELVSSMFWPYGL